MASGGQFWGHSATPQSVAGQPGHFETPKGGQFSTFMFTGGQLQPRTHDNRANDPKETATVPRPALQGNSARHDPKNVYHQSPAGSRPPKKRGRPPKDSGHSTYLSTPTNPPITATIPLAPPGPSASSGASPFHRGPYRTSEDAFFNLQLHVFTSGYGVSQKRGVREKLSNGKYDPEGELIRKDFCCDKGGRQFKSVSTGQRKRVSTKTGCTWSATARRLKREGDQWFLEILQPDHNHPATPQDEMTNIPAYRRWQKENGRGIRKAVSRLSRAAAMPPKQLQAYLRGNLADPELDLLDKQIIRALSMGADNDGEDGDSRDQACTVFDVFMNRPTLVLAEDRPRTQASASYEQPAIPRRRPPQEDQTSSSPLQAPPPPQPTLQQAQPRVQHQPQLPPPPPPLPPAPPQIQSQQQHQNQHQPREPQQVQPRPSERSSPPLPKQSPRQPQQQQQGNNVPKQEEDPKADQMDEDDEEDDEDMD